MAISCAKCGLNGIDPRATRCPRCGASVGPGATPIAAPATSGRPCLVSSLGKTHYLLPAGNSRIGRVASAVMVEDASVPDFAATLTAAGGGYLLRDVSGRTQVNGRGLAREHALQSGDVIRVGAVDLTYRGPNTVAPLVAAPAPPPTAPPPIVAVVAPPVLPARPPARGPAPVFPLRDWAAARKPLPALEGLARYVVEPLRLEDPNVMGKLIAAAALGLIRAWLAMLPMNLRREWWISQYRVESFADGTVYDVICYDKAPLRVVELGDQVAMWGKDRDGCLVLHEVYIYKSHTSGRTYRPKRPRGMG